LGLHRTFDYVRLDALSAAVRAGARFVATNDDATFPTPHGLVPGGGSLVAAVATAAGVSPTIAGKPHLPMAAAVTARVGERFVPQRALMVGDKLSTDGAFAVTLGCPFALVRTGVTPPGGRVDDVPVAVDAPDLMTLVGLMLG
jgi:4-nitrophenyl phosphatase